MTTQKIKERKPSPKDVKEEKEPKAIKVEKEAVSTEVSIEVTTEATKEEVEALPPVPGAAFPNWTPRTEIGEKVYNQEIVAIDEILDKGLRILEPEIVDVLIKNLETDLLLIGQAKGKFGGGQRRVFKQTQKKTPEGNKPRFATFAVVGNHNGYVGIGYGKSKETVPAREKAFRNAKTAIIKVRRGCGSWECACKEPHSIPFAVKGKVGSVIITLMPAPKGTGLKVEPECQKILTLAGNKDIRSHTKGQTRTKTNLIKACMLALRELMLTKVQPNYVEQLGVLEGRNPKHIAPEKVEKKWERPRGKRKWQNRRR